MLATDITKVNKIDNAISDMHQQLNKLYEQRQQLLNPISVSIASTSSPSDIWKQLGVTLPATKKFAATVSKAQQLANELASEDSRLKDQLCVVVVPPSKLLDAALSKLEQQGTQRYSCIDQELYRIQPENRDWQVILVARLSWRMPVHGLSRFMTERAYLWAGHNARALGVRELLAADVQGVQVVQPGANTVLIKRLNQGIAPCITSNNAELRLDTEDSDCLLGENYIQPAILVK